MTTIRILRYAVLAGWQDYRTIYTWRSWLVGWYIRVLAQVSFFALIGRLLGSDERTHYLLIGNAVLLAAMGSLLAVASTAWERWSGTLPLLVASPSSPIVVFTGRSAWAWADGVLSSLGAFFVAAPLFGFDLPWPQVALVVPLVALVGASSYAFGTFLGGLVLRAPGLRNVVSNVAWGTMLAICGVNVPVSFYPRPVEWLAQVLPLTHGLRAVRGVLSGASAGSVAANAVAEAGVAIGWLLLAAMTFDRLTSQGRRDGTIEFG